MVGFGWFFFLEGADIYLVISLFSAIVISSYLLVGQCSF